MSDHGTPNAMPGVKRSLWQHEKTSACAQHGMVVARHPLAAEAGCEVLRQGGNAIDAVVAASFAGSVVQPVANTIGGGGLVVLHTPTAGTQAIDYLYSAPAKAHTK